jgi:hypothetical protein
MLDIKLLDAVTENQLDDFIGELFSNFNGLIVIDDIDNLSRERRDTGEEFLFLKAAKSASILYTLRFPATYALKNAVTVPGASNLAYHCLQMNNS